MARIAQAQKDAVSVIAHAFWASQVENNVPGMKGYEAAWLKAQTPHGRALVEFFKAELKRIRRDVVKMMEAEKNGSPS